MELTGIQRTPSSSSVSSSIPRWTYDVFLSFHNKDTGKSFADHLYASLKQRKISYFRDDEKLEQENSTSEELSKAIQESQFAVVVVSEHYTSSKSCLTELIKIVECKREMGLKILPVIYCVDPSEIRKQKGSFAQVFTVHGQDHAIDEEQIKSWRAASEEVGSLPGWHLHDRNVAIAIQRIVRRIEVGLGREASNTSQSEIYLNPPLQEQQLRSQEWISFTIPLFRSILSSLQVRYSYIKQLQHGSKDDFGSCRLTKREGYQDAYPGDLARLVLTVEELYPRLDRLWVEPFGLVLDPQSVLQFEDYLAETDGKEAIKEEIRLETQGGLLETVETDVKWKSGERNEKSGAEYDASRKHKKLENEEIGIELETSKTGLERYSHTNILREVQLCLMQGGLGLSEPPKDELWENAERICLMDNELSILPENPKCPALLALYLQRNYTLRTIPLSFFDDMPALQILNLSRTRIRSLPKSIVKLVNLKRLFLNDCHCFMMLSPDVGGLKRLEVLDLEGTDILKLPKEIKQLTNLTCLKVSLYSYLDDGKSDMQSDSTVHCDIISALSRLGVKYLCKSR